MDAPSERRRIASDKPFFYGLVAIAAAYLLLHAIFYLSERSHVERTTDYSGDDDANDKNNNTSGNPNDRETGDAVRRCMRVSGGMLFVLYGRPERRGDSAVAPGFRCDAASRIELGTG